MHTGVTLCPPPPHVFCVRAASPFQRATIQFLSFLASRPPSLAIASLAHRAVTIFQLAHVPPSHRSLGAQGQSPAGAWTKDAVAEDHGTSSAAPVPSPSPPYNAMLTKVCPMLVTPSHQVGELGSRGGRIRAPGELDSHQIPGDAGVRRRRSDVSAVAGCWAMFAVVNVSHLIPDTGLASLAGQQGTAGGRGDCSGGSSAVSPKSGF